MFLRCRGKIHPDLVEPKTVNVTDAHIENTIQSVREDATSMNIDEVVSHPEK